MNLGKMEEPPRNFIRKDEVMLRVVTGRGDGCLVGLTSVGQCQTRVTFYSTISGGVVVQEIVTDDQIVKFIEDHQDW